ncbi:efflux RND transporter periplasmic adaptor subunit [Verrucomicrobia bacterium]|nr:efflux RND transporter periplasmic adaptor subunit [Verrucomicrobiota bacterium]
MMQTNRKNAVQFLGTIMSVGMLLNTSYVDAAEAVAVKTVQPTTKILKHTTSQPATARAFYEAELYSKVAGYVGVLNADIGDHVKTGQPLLEILVPEMEKAYQRSVAEEQRSVAEVTQSNAAIEVARALVNQAGADVSKAEAQVSADRSEFKRITALAKTGVVNQRVKDESASRMEAGEAELKSVLESKKVASANLRASEAQRDATRASATVAQKTVEEMRVMMDYSVIKAPFDGVVTQRSVDPGDLARNEANSSGEAKPLFTVSKVDVLRVTIPVPERDAVWVTKGDVAEMSFSAFPGQTFMGVVARRSGQLDPRTRTMKVEVDLPNGEGLLIPGMYGTVVIIMQEKSAMVVPANAIRFDKTGAESVVYVVQGGSSVARVPVTIGIDDGHTIEILSGLKGSEQLVTGMLGRLQDGQAVTVLSN